jgi:hypothetical protein
LWIGLLRNSILARSVVPFSYKILYKVAELSQTPCGLSHGSTATRLLELRVWIPPGARMSVSCECCVLSCRFPCVGLNSRPKESYRVWRIWV